MSKFMRKLSLKPDRSSRDASPTGAHQNGDKNSHKSDSSEQSTSKENPLKRASREIHNRLQKNDDSSTNLEKINESPSSSKDPSQKNSRRASGAIERKDAGPSKQAIGFEERRKRLGERADKADTPNMRSKYGWVEPNSYAGEFTGRKYTNIRELSQNDIGEEVTFRARIHNFRKLSSKLAFFLLRQQTSTIQGVLQEAEAVSAEMVYWAEHIPVETIVLVHGVVQKPKAKEGEVTGAFIHDIEIMIRQMHIESKLQDHLPFTVNEAEVTQEEADADDSTRHHVSDRARLNARVLDLRTTTSQAIFRVQSGICRLFRNYLDSQGFMEIHTPKLQGGATESGASVFKLDYFGRAAFLAQSPQLAKQLSIIADFGKVYEIGAVFRAENSNTHRHLTEYTGLDLEMAIDEHYHEMLRTVDNLLKSIFGGILKNNRTEIDIIKRQHPHEDMVWLEETPVFSFKEAIQLLNDSGWRDDAGEPLPLDEDLGTKDEIQLGRVIKEKFNTDYYIIDKFPTSARPFYTMPDPNNPTYTNSFDVFVRGQEIISGGERIHDAQMLATNMRKFKVDPTSVEDYMQGFEWGAPPHAGAGIGLERILMLMMQLGDIRHASMYPRDPKSLPAKPPTPKLRHPDSSTLHPPWEGSGRNASNAELQPLEKLIANYGDASNTSWLEARTVIWRDMETGAAVGYVPHNGFAIIVGDPLCYETQYSKVVSVFLSFLKRETELKPLWLLCGEKLEEVLAGKLDWRTFTVVAEQRMNLISGSASTRSFQNPEIQRKIRHSEKEGVKIKDVEIGTHVPKDVMEKCDKRIEDWLGNRKGHQHVHLTDVHPWQDMEHRQYHYAVKSDGQICALLVLAQLAPKHGWQVKYSLDFPGSPNGVIEALVIHGLKAIQTKGEPGATFGAGATSEFTPGHNLKGTKIKMLSRAYHTIATDLKLTQKSEFREKLGAEEDDIYICYPPKGLGPKGIRAILTFFED